MLYDIVGVNLASHPGVLFKIVITIPRNLEMYIYLLKEISSIPFHLIRPSKCLSLNW